MAWQRKVKNVAPDVTEARSIDGTRGTRLSMFRPEASSSASAKSSEGVSIKKARSRKLRPDRTSISFQASSSSGDRPTRPSDPDTP